jgi:hypothetical protein
MIIKPSTSATPSSKFMRLFSPDFYPCVFLFYDYSTLADFIVVIKFGLRCYRGY